VQPLETEYVDVGGVRLAYQVWGDGEIPAIGVPNWSSNTDAISLMDSWVDFAGRVSHAMRMVLYDQRGTGLSDRVAPVETLEEAAGDLLAVVDHIGAERVVLISADMSTPTALAFAALHPERTHSLFLACSTARLFADDGYDVGLPLENLAAMRKLIREGWGRADSPYAYAGVPGEPGDERSLDRAQVARVQRQAAAPSDIDRLIERWVHMDARPYVERIQAPALVVHRRHDRLVPFRHGKWLVEHLPNARLLELPGDIHYIWLADRAQIARELLDFVRSEAVTSAERKLAAVVVTDIADSTGRAAALGHEQWRMLLDRHDSAIRRALRRFGGNERNTAGDSFVATFASAEAATRFAMTALDDARGAGVELRAGIHVGEVDERDGHLHGLGVHVASRVQTSAQPGQVLVTTGVREALVGTAGLTFLPGGEHELRGVPDTWTLWQATAVR
jgi:pimeloyl-ACP methyl ester carboxylesterase